MISLSASVTLEVNTTNTFLKTDYTFGNRPTASIGLVRQKQKFLSYGFLDATTITDANNIQIHKHTINPGNPSIAGVDCVFITQYDFHSATGRTLNAWKTGSVGCCTPDALITNVKASLRVEPILPAQRGDRSTTASSSPLEDAL